MSEKTGKTLGPNAQKKQDFWNRTIQASIDACYERRRLKREKREKLRQKIEYLHLQRLYNFNKRMVVVFAILDGNMVILTIIDQSLITCTYTTGRNDHIIYGDCEYWRLQMTASHNSNGKRFEKDGASYTVSTVDGINFNVTDIKGKVFSFESSILHETLAGKTFSDIKFDQWLYSPSNVESDEKTKMIHAELLKLIEEDEKYLRKNPQIVGYIPYSFV